MYSTLKNLSTQIKFFTANPFYDLTRTNLQLHSSFKHIIFFRNKFSYLYYSPQKDTKRKMICQVLPLEQKYDDVTTKVVWERLIVVDKCSRREMVFFLGHTLSQKSDLCPKSIFHPGFDSKMIFFSSYGRCRLRLINPWIRKLMQET